MWCTLFDVPATHGTACDAPAHAEDVVHVLFGDVCTEASHTDRSLGCPWKTTFGVSNSSQLVARGTQYTSTQVHRRTVRST